MFLQQTSPRRALASAVRTPGRRALLGMPHKASPSSRLCVLPARLWVHESRRRCLSYSKHRGGESGVHTRERRSPSVAMETSVLSCPKFRAVPNGLPCVRLQTPPQGDVSLHLKGTDTHVCVKNVNQIANYPSGHLSHTSKFHLVVCSHFLHRRRGVYFKVEV